MRKKFALHSARARGRSVAFREVRENILSTTHQLVSLDLCWVLNCLKELGRGKERDSVLVQVTWTSTYWTSTCLQPPWAPPQRGPLTVVVQRSTCAALHPCFSQCFKEHHINKMLAWSTACLSEVIHPFPCVTSMSQHRFFEVKGMPSGWNYQVVYSDTSSITHCFRGSCTFLF